MCDAGADSEIRADSAAPPAEVNQETKNYCALGTVSLLLIKGIADRRRRVQKQRISIPDEIALQAEVVVHMRAGKQVCCCTIGRRVRRQTKTLRKTLGTGISRQCCNPAHCSRIGDDSCQARFSECRQQTCNKQYKFGYRMNLNATFVA